jgi:hypothetical protein
VALRDNQSDCRGNRVRNDQWSKLMFLQEVLHVESTNLDMHCEGAVSYRNILANRALCASVPNITEEILKGILVNLNRQKDNRKCAVLCLLCGCGNIYACVRCGGGCVQSRRSNNV